MISLYKEEMRRQRVGARTRGMKNGKGLEVRGLGVVGPDL